MGARVVVGPPHVDYEITALGLTTIPAIEAWRAWGALSQAKGVVTLTLRLRLPALFQPA